MQPSEAWGPNLVDLQTFVFGVRMTPGFASSTVIIAHNANAAYSRTQLRRAGVKKDTESFWKAFLSSLC